MGQPPEGCQPREVALDPLTGTSLLGAKIYFFFAFFPFLAVGAAAPTASATATETGSSQSTSGKSFSTDSANRSESTIVKTYCGSSAKGSSGNEIGRASCRERV